MTQKQASDACERQDLRLPTAREVALEGVKNGAALLEVNDYKAGKIPLGYAKSDFYLLTTQEVDGSKDSFYYAHNNYQTPAGDLGNYWIWSSSLLSVYSVGAFVFSGGNGLWSTSAVITVMITVRCGPLRCPRESLILNL